MDFITECGAGREGLRVKINRIWIVLVLHPLMGVQMKDMSFFRPGVHVAEAHGVAHVGMMDVGRIVRVKSAFGRVGCRIAFDHHRRIAVRPRGQEKFFEFAFSAMRRWPDALLIGQDHRPKARSAVVDCHAVTQRVQRVGLVVKLGIGLHSRYFVMEDRRELAVGLAADAAGASDMSAIFA